jgi:hypothetical protein
VTSAFVSYAHEDQELMLELVEHLRAQDLDIRYDQVVLRIGDSLIQKIAGEIADGDFLIAIISPDSVESGWCQRELSLAATQGIDEKRAKVLPVRFRGAPIPAMLGDTFYGDADRFSVETIAEQLAAAMRAHLEGRDDDAGQEAEAVERAGGEPPHAETVGDATVAQIEEVAQRAWDVFQAWEGVWNDGGNINDLNDPRRRLRWALDQLPGRLRGALPLVEQMANADRDQFFADADLAEVERDMRAELLAVRTRIAQGLPVVGRWLVVGSDGEVSAQGRDATAYHWWLQRGEERKPVTVFISGTAMASANEYLPNEVAAAKNTHGRSVLSQVSGLDDPPKQVSVSTAGIGFGLPN